MDEKDRKLVALLQDDARMSVSTLAGKLGSARTTVQARLQRLEREGIIAGYTVRLGELEQARKIRATILLQLDPRAAPSVITRLNILPEIRKASTSSGRFDLVLQVASDSTSELDALLDTIGEMPGVKSSESLIHLSTKIDRGL